MEKNIPEGTKFNGVIGGTFTWSNGGVGIEDTIRRIVREEIAAHEERPCSEIASNKKPYYGVEVKP